MTKYRIWFGIGLPLILLLGCGGGSTAQKPPEHLDSGMKPLVKGIEKFQKGCYRQSLDLFLKAHEQSARLPDLVRKHGFSEQSFYRWKSKFGGMDVSDAKRLRELGAKNAKLQKLLAEAELDKAMLKDVLGRKW